MTYLLVNLATLILPLAFSFLPRIRYTREWKVLFPSLVVTGSVFVAWDALFASQGVWSFDAAYLLGPTFFGLPLEEYLFFICIPYACLFTWFVLRNTLLAGLRGGRYFFPVTAGVSVLMAALAVWHYDRWYTLTAFGSCALALLGALRYLRNGLAGFLASYAVLLVPFFAVNGILTGSFLGHVVVRYNDAENLGIRLLTIPVEDVFYGLSLLLWTVLLMEWFRKKQHQTVHQHEPALFI
jgi:lycopene cyclase domain-containing protein